MRKGDDEKTIFSWRNPFKSFFKLILLLFLVYLIVFLWSNLTSDDVFCTDSKCFFPTLWDENGEESSFIDLAGYSWWRKKFVILIDEKKYDYCNVPLNIWKGYESSQSKGEYYNTSIRDRYSCNDKEVSRVPDEDCLSFGIYKESMFLEKQGYTLINNVWYDKEMGYPTGEDSEEAEIILNYYYSKCMDG